VLMVVASAHHWPFSVRGGVNSVRIAARIAEMEMSMANSYLPSDWRVEETGTVGLPNEVM